MPTELNNTAVLLGSAWLVLGIAYPGMPTRGFRREPPEPRPKAGEHAVGAAASQ
ncbi:hypothetical protein [Streptomyces pactum]|uniref:hypothetical protein n=1 Tax=Streptomyces pactum TaxID=68249 RepID=UPI000A74B4E5|nr:hypothetical protein [Streptomyces pactum]